MSLDGQSHSIDGYLDALANGERRALLYALLTHNPQSDTPAVVSAFESEPHDRVVRMKHVHLPKLEDHGLVVWNRERAEVSKGPKFDDLRQLLELMHDHEVDPLPEEL